MAHWQDQPIFRDYLIEYFQSSSYLSHHDAEVQIEVGNVNFSSRAPMEQAKWHSALGDYYFMDQNNYAGALDCYNLALLKSDRNGSPNRVSQRAHSMASQVMVNMGNLPGAQAHAALALKYAEHLEDAHGQAVSFLVQAKCQILLANFKRVQILLQNSRHIVDSCGLQTCTIDQHLRSVEADIHLLKSEYLESRQIQLLILSTQPNMYYSIFAMLNIALIDTVSGLDSKLVQKNLETCEIHLRALVGRSYIETSLMLKASFAVLHLRDGELNKANTILIDAKLAEIDLAVLVKYEEQLQQISELQVPVSAPEEEEEEEEEFAQGSDVKGKGREEVWV
ncbi:hypothetical protein C8J57DRAFT_1610428 [Mycena rebaudengoi]|nr:hypothetical protein C8J57DRAFT_1610428 [Mycena rebaudengoi]